MKVLYTWLSAIQIITVIIIKSPFFLLIKMFSNFKWKESLLFEIKTHWRRKFMRLVELCPFHQSLICFLLIFMSFYSELKNRPFRMVISICIWIETIIVSQYTQLKTGNFDCNLKRKERQHWYIMGKWSKRTIITKIEIWLKWKVQKPNYFCVCSWILNN